MELYNASPCDKLTSQEAVLLPVSLVQTRCRSQEGPSRVPTESPGLLLSSHTPITQLSLRELSLREWHGAPGPQGF